MDQLSSSIFKTFPKKHAQHLNQVSCDLISHKKILLLVFGFPFCKQQKGAVLPGYFSSDTLELYPGLKNCNFLQICFSFELVDQKSFITACNHTFFAFLSSQHGFLKMFNFLSSDNTLGGVSTCQVSSF